MPRTTLVPASNHLIAGLPRKDRQRFLTGCETTELVFAEVLAESGKRIHHVYFPTQSFISLVKPLDSHGSQAMRLVGDEGRSALHSSSGWTFRRYTPWCRAQAPRYA